MSFICHIHNYTEYNEEWNVFSAFNPSKCTHLEQWAADCAAPGEQSWTSCRSRDSNPQLWVTSGFKSNALANAIHEGGSCASFIVPGWWNELPTPIRNAESLTIFKWHLKTHLLHHHLTSSKNKIKEHILHSLSLTWPLFPLTSHCLARILASL